MSESKKPQDHKPPQSELYDGEAHVSEPFPFTHAGILYHLKSGKDVVTAGFARTRRHLSQVEQLFEMLELLADKEALAAIDEMLPDEFTQFQTNFYTWIGGTPGESKASSSSSTSPN